MSNSLQSTSVQRSEGTTGRTLLRTLTAKGWRLPVGFIGLIFVVAVFAPVVAPFDPAQQDILQRFTPPGWPHLLGTDKFGRDNLSRVIYGARVALIVAVGGTAMAMVGGVLLGLLGGFYRGWVEQLSQRTADVIFAFPPIMLALLTVTVFGPGTVTVTCVIGVLYMPKFARITFTQASSLARLEYVDAARVAGASDLRLMLSSILRNALAPLVAQASLSVASALLLESGLSFLGLGVVPPDSSWGLMIASGVRFLDMNIWSLLIPSALVVLTILAFGRIGDLVRDALDPRIRSAIRS